LIQQQVLADAARATLEPGDELGLENEARAFLAGRILDRVAGAPISDTVLEEAYEKAYGDAAPEVEYNASHILVETEEEAAAIIAELEGGGDFAAIAQERSTGPSGPSGGELGWFGAGMMVPEFEAAVLALEPGSISAPVQTQFGWHVVRLNETRRKDAPALADVRSELEQQVRTAAVDAEVSRLSEAAEVERMEVEIDPALIRNDDLLKD
ncbi:MAG: peptidylprolyl isomerase, partial [Jannaschia sp.]